MKAALYMEHNGIKIFHAYKDCTPLCYWYSTQCNGITGDKVRPGDFDVRNLPAYSTDKTHKEIIQDAIEKGLINV